MRVIGLTGSVGMGKSTVAAQFEALGAKICNADAIVHELLAEGGKAVAEVKIFFPEAVHRGKVDRARLGDIVFGDEAKRRRLEALLHPLVVEEENRFMQRERRKGARLVVLDIPLLYETGGAARCHEVIVASAPHFLQWQRVKKRGLAEKKFRRILSLQWPDRVKRRLADGVILTGLGRAYSFRQLATWLHHA